MNDQKPIALHQSSQNNPLRILPFESAVVSLVASNLYPFALQRLVEALKAYRS